MPLTELVIASGGVFTSATQVLFDLLALALMAADLDKPDIREMWCAIEAVDPIRPTPYALPTITILAHLLCSPSAGFSVFKGSAGLLYM